MNIVKSSIIALLTIGLMSISAGLSFAKNNHSPEEIKALKDSVVALQNLDPDLSKKLSDYAAEEEKESENMANDNDMDVNKEIDGRQLLLKAADELKASYPELSAGLTKYAEKEQEEINEMKKEIQKNK